MFDRAQVRDFKFKFHKILTARSDLGVVQVILPEGKPDYQVFSPHAHNL